MRLGRRRFLALAAAAPALGAAPPRRGIRAIEHDGVLIGECSLEGETRADDVVPGQASAIPLSRDRWLVLTSTRGFRFVDDDRSIVYQLRRGGSAGPVIREGRLARFRDERQHGHPVAFGVPKGARIGGKPAPNANVFAAKWRWGEKGARGVEWVQFRLNDRDDDLEILQPPVPLRQKGYEEGPEFCSAGNVAWMNQTFTPPVAWSRDCTEWADCNYFDGGRIAALKYAFRSGRYEWIETGPAFSEAGRNTFEPSLARFRDSWVVCARSSGGVARGGAGWTRTDDPFRALPPLVYPASPATDAPVTAFRCADGRLRLFGGDHASSPYRRTRDPLYAWEIDPDRGFACSDRRLIFDSLAAGLPLRLESWPKIDMPKLLPAEGNVQRLVHRVSVRSFNAPYPNRPAIPLIAPAEKAACATYSARIVYDEVEPLPWGFVPG